MIYRFLDTNGNGTGTKNAVGNYSPAGDGATPFYYEVPVGKNRVEIHRMVFDLTDTAGIQQDEYGNTGGALVNGFTFQVIDTDGSTVLLDMCDSVAIKTNGDWGRYCYDVNLLDWGTSPANQSVQVRWTWARAGQPIILDEGQRVQVTLNDDFTGLIEHYFMLHGFF